MRSVSLLFVVTLLLCIASCVMASEHHTAAHTECLRECRQVMPEAAIRKCGLFCSSPRIRPLPRPHPQQAHLMGRPRPQPIDNSNSNSNPEDILAETEAEVMAQQAAGTLDPSKLWNQYRSVLFNFLRKGDSNSMPHLQLVTQPLSVDWHNNPEQLNELAGRLSRAGVTNEWNGKYLVDQYRDFIYNIAAPVSAENPALEARLAGWETKLSDAEQGIMMANMQCAMNYGMFSASLGANTPPFESFKNMYCSYQIRKAEDKYDLTLADAERDASSAYGTFFDAKRALAKFIKAPTKDFVALSSLATFTQKSEAGTTNGFNVKVTSKSSVSSEKESSWNIGIQATIPVFGVPVTVGASYSKGKIELKSNAEEFQVEVGAGGLTYIPVLPSTTWFSHDVLSKYQNGPFTQPKSYFRDTDGMKYAVRGFFVVSKPKLVLYTSQQDAQEMQKTSALGLSVSVMGIGFNFGKNDRMKTAQTADKGYRVEITGEDPTPQLLAVDLVKLPL